MLACVSGFVFRVLSRVVIFCRFYRGMMSLPDVKVPLFVADGLCRRMFLCCDDGAF